jgi:phage antirepressor YoqD-like protein
MTNNLLSFDPVPTVTVVGVPLRTDEQGRYRLADLHAASGGDANDKPSNWLRMSKTVDLIDELDRFSNMRSDHKSVNVVNGGPDSGTYVSEDLVVDYAMWISAAFKVKVIHAFKESRLRTEEPQTPALNDPKALRAMLLGYTERVIELEATIEEQRPHVEHAKAIMRTDDLITMRDMAQTLTQNGYKIGRNTLFTQLTTDGVIASDKKPYAEYQHWFFLESNAFTDKQGIEHASHTLLVTPAGEAGLIRKYVKKNEIRPSARHAESEPKRIEDRRAQKQKGGLFDKTKHAD